MDTDPSGGRLIVTLYGNETVRCSEPPLPFVNVIRTVHGLVLQVPVT
jgi:hypothetical protein